MKKIILTLGIVLAVAGIAIWYLRPTRIISPLGNPIIPAEKKLLPYSYTALQKTTYLGSPIIIDKVLKDGAGFTSYLFYFTVKGKKISGLLNVPKSAGNYPAIVMIRGYVDKEIYSPGVGTSHGGELLAQNGFITLAPDFMGYGYSDAASPDAMEDRFLAYITVLELLSSLKHLNVALEQQSLPARFDMSHIGIWGHSNGGQIALSVLEISGGTYPTVLWAPVSKPFPYSILYYTDDIPDHGKALRKVVADFESEYNAENYSPTNFFNWINAPLQIHQGGADESVPQTWSDLLVSELKKLEKNVTYYTYPGEDHNFDKGNWTTVMQRTMEFYKKQFAAEQ